MAMSSHGGKRLLTVVLDFASFNLYMKTNSTLRSYFQAYTYLGKHFDYFLFDDKPKVKTIWFPFGILAYWCMSSRWKLLSCSWHQTTKPPILFSPIFSTNFSQFEQLKKKTNFLLVQNSFFSQFEQLVEKENKLFTGPKQFFFIVLDQ